MMNPAGGGREEAIVTTTKFGNMGDGIFSRWRIA